MMLHIGADLTILCSSVCRSVCTVPAVVRLCLFCYLPISIDLCFLENEPSCVPSGEEAATGIVASITPGNPTIVSCVDDEKMDFQVYCATCPHGLGVATVSRQQPTYSCLVFRMARW